MPHILLIEPDIQLGNIYSDYLAKEHDYDIVWRTTAQASLTSIDKNRPDLIILELQLTAHNGIEFLYELRSYSDLQDIPVIVHSLVPPMLKAISPMLWTDLRIAGYYYKPSTKLRDLSNAIENTMQQVALTRPDVGRVNKEQRSKAYK